VKKSILTLLFLLAVAVPAHAVLIGGVEFPDGAVSFADSVYSYAPGANVGPLITQVFLLVLMDP